MPQIFSQSSGCGGKPKDEHGTATAWWRWFTGNITAVCPRDSAGDGQAEACACFPPIPSRVEADKPIKDPLAVGSGNARSGVVHRDGNGAGRTGYDDTNRFTSRADSARVVQQIRDDLADPGGIDGRSRGRPLGDQ